MYPTVTIGVNPCEGDSPQDMALSVNEAFSFIGLMYAAGLVVWIADGDTSMLVAATGIALFMFAANRGTDGRDD